jgi:hypothetical protein
MLGNLLGGFITILVGVNLIGPVADSVAGVSGNVTGASLTILSLVTLFFALAVMSAGIAIAAIGLRQSGLLGM